MSGTTKTCNGYMLIRLVSATERPIFFVVKQTIDRIDGKPSTDQIAANKNWVGEHTCPINLINRSEAIIEGSGTRYNQDPHGLLEFVAWASEPVIIDGTNQKQWRSIFPQLCDDTIVGLKPHPETKMPFVWHQHKREWDSQYDGFHLFLGGLYVGLVYAKGKMWCAEISTNEDLDGTIGSFNTELEAKTAVETEIRKLLTLLPI